jgi:hypothetical protein
MLRASVERKRIVSSFSCQNDCDAYENRLRSGCLSARLKMIPFDLKLLRADA